MDPLDVDECGRERAFFNLAEMRAAEGVSQSTFWHRYGVSQSGGCRYETVRLPPRSLLMLIWLHQQHRLTEADLADALYATRPSGLGSSGRGSKAGR